MDKFLPYCYNQNGVFYGKLLPFNQFAITKNHNIMKTQTLKLLAAITLLFAFINVHGQESNVTLEFDNAETAQVLVQNYVKALQAGDVDAMNAQLADNAMIYGLGGGLDSLNVTQHMEYFKNSTAAYNHEISQDIYLPVKVADNWYEGEWVLTWGTNTVTNKETGKSFSIPYHTVNLVQNGKIIMTRYYYDMLNILESQGYTITPPSE